MDEQLWVMDEKRLTKLRRPDLPQLAQAIVDAEQGLAQVGANQTRGRTFVNLKRKGHYNLYVRGEDWERIMPFLRHSTDSFEFEPLPVDPPDPVMSPQPNRTMAPIREGLSGGRSYMDRFPYEEQRQLTDLLTSTGQITTLDAPNLPSRTLFDHTPGAQVNPPVPPQVNPLPKPATALDMREEQFRRRVLDLLLQLFPEDFPTSAL